MKNIRYAFASVSYHKKISFCIGVCSAFFLFLSTSILNLIDMEKNLYKQVSNLANISDYITNYQKITRTYFVLYLILICLWTILITALVYISLKMKKQDIIKWRIMGFSNRFVIKQSIWEILIPALAGIITTALFLLVCQHTYEFILNQIKPLIANGMGIKRVAFFSSNVVLESIPNQFMNTTGNTHFLSLEISQLPVATVFKAFIKNCLILVSTTTIVTLFLTYSFSRKSKQVFRM
ncbi:hypothetical protein [Enterococcus sp. 5H]|uniref:hypothetical protein n=1 Tax=Enterococcus sp. 5H TaxID=1229490 RepID=UPI002303A3E8|nr:hypothetical protein [Enterococcus sp. 5H]MDA9470431.1 hypothetical protein [Enterococcus sp. 5H]